VDPAAPAAALDFLPIFRPWYDLELISADAEQIRSAMSKSRIKSGRQEKLRERRRDPQYASAMPWNWQLCNDCGSLVPRCCPRCGGTSFNNRPREIIRAGLNKHGYPPILHQGG
jgi:hypothetical protein